VVDRKTPVRPATEGTVRFPDSIGGVFTAGAGAVEAIRKISEQHGVIAADTETYGLGRDALDLKCVQLGTADHAVVLDPRDPLQAEAIRLTFQRAEEIVFHNAAFDVVTLVHNRLLRMEDIGKITDTLIYCRLADPGDRSGLAAASSRHLGTEDGDVLLKAFKVAGLSRTEGYRRFDIDRPVYLRGAAIDVVMTARLLPAVRAAALSMLTENHPFGVYGLSLQEALVLREREQRINRIFLKRYAKGLRVDFDYLDTYREQTAQDKERAELKLRSLGITPGNGNHLTSYLDGQGAIPEDHPRTAKTGAPSAAKKDLEALDHPVARLFVQHKEIVKIEDDYLSKCADMASADGRIHPMLSILGAATGRMSLGNPPLQQFSGPARGVILAEEGDAFTSIDWSQIEPVVAANLAGEQRVIENYENGTSDLYTEVAIMSGLVPAGTTPADCEVKGTPAAKGRKNAKTVLLAQMYGEGMTKLAGDLGMSVQEAFALRDRIFAGIPEIGGMIQKLKRIARRHKKVFTVSGRIVNIPEGFYDGEKSVQAHKGVNYFVQGSAYDVLAESIVAVDEAGLSDAVHLAMHDELVVSTGAARDIEKIMQTPPERLCWIAGRTPVLRTDRLDLGNRWAEA
jgi:DNA polymerase-1